MMRVTLRAFHVVALLLLVPEAAAAQRVVTLEEAYRLAARSNPTVTMLQERVAQAEAARYRAYSSVKPTASFQGTFTHYDQEIVVDFSKMSPIELPEGSSKPIVIQKQDQFGFLAGVTVPIFRGAAYPRIDMAKKNVEAARLRTIRNMQDFLLRVAQAYYLAVSRKDVVQAIEAKVAVDKRHLQAAQERFEVGQAPRSEVLRAELVLTQDEQNLLAQRNALEAAKRQIAILIGVSEDIDVVRPAEPEDVAASEGEMVTIALERRLDLKAADVALKMAKKNVEAVYWGFLPSLDGGFMYRWTEAAGFANKRGTWNLTLTLTVPIYDGGLRYADLREARSRLVEARAQKEALDMEMRSELVRLRSELASATAGLAAAEKALALARTTAQDIEASFEVGTATQLDVLDANQRLLEAEIQLTSTLHTRDLARLALAHAQGRFDPLRGGR